MEMMAQVQHAAIARILHLCSGNSQTKPAVLRMNEGAREVKGGWKDGAWTFAQEFASGVPINRRPASGDPLDQISIAIALAEVHTNHETFLRLMILVS